jgi:hypothetical protein
MIDALLRAGAGKPSGELLEGIFGSRRSLYKRLAQFSYFEEPEMYRRMARRPFAELVQLAERIAAELSRAIGTRISPHEVLVDAPPVELEVDFNIDVYFRKQRSYRPLGEISPVVRTLAREQFDDFVKRVRVFVHPRIAKEARAARGLSQLLEIAVSAK